VPDALYQVDLAASARKELRALPRNVLERVFPVLKELANTPRLPGSKKLTNHLSAWRVRVGDYRIVYTIDDRLRVVEVIRIAHRGEVYR
jgi:mRNA interferase RelE/StbE